MSRDCSGANVLCLFSLAARHAWTATIAVLLVFAGCVDPPCATRGGL
jgi:hypothetical protein